MKATEAGLLEFLRKSPQFRIPIYQRTYSWTESECRQLWEDIIRCGKDDKIPVHFIGSIVYIESGLSQVSHQAPLLVIDGQQRLTTVTLLLAALADAVGDEEPFDGFTARKIRNYFLLNAEESGERYYKLLLSQTDKASLTAIVGQKELPQERSLRVTENVDLFRSLIAQNKADLPDICKGIAKLVIVDIALTRDQDNPQLIFESMNSTGKELSQADLIRNFILMGLEPDLQTRLYEDYWRPMEEEFGQQAYSEYFDGFMRRYLTMKTGKVPRRDEVYDVFKQFARLAEAAQEDGQDVEELVKDIRSHAGYYCAIALGQEQHRGLREAFADLCELRVEPVYAFLLAVYADYAKEMLTVDDFIEIVRLLEAYVFRRAVCSIPTNSMLKTFATFGRKIDRSRYVESVKAQVQMMRAYRRFPSNEEFVRDLQRRDLYNFRNRTYWLRKLENHGKKERVGVDNYTVEHILPQNPNLNERWRNELGENWKKIQQSWLHTIGNLTLTGYNSEYSDRSFAEKRDMEGGFAQSPLRLNEGLGNVQEWDEESIKQRADRLAQHALIVWPRHELDEAAIESFAPKKAAKRSYSLDDLPYLDQPHTRKLFDQFREFVLGISRDVSEKLLRRAITYQVKRGFVTVVPLKMGLRVILNLKFAEVDDPKGVCSDLTGKGHWGRGDVRALIRKPEDLGDVVPFVEQAFRKWS